MWVCNIKAMADLIQMSCAEGRWLMEMAQDRVQWQNFMFYYS
jgi:hypothetical protein